MVPGLPLGLGGRTVRMLLLDGSKAAPAIIDVNQNETVSCSIDMQRCKSRHHHAINVIHVYLRNRDTDSQWPYLCKKRLHPAYSSLTTRARPGRAQTPAPVSGAQISPTEE